MYIHEEQRPPDQKCSRTCPFKEKGQGSNSWQEERGFLEDGFVCEIRGYCEVGWRRTLCQKEDSLCSRVEWKLETVRSDYVRDAQQAKWFELCSMAVREARGGI